MPVPAGRQKRVAPQTLIGEGGVSLIARRVNQMGYLYHDRRVDHGIDGEIELVTADGVPLNSVVMVQSKASTRHHAFENTNSFQWTADSTDLDYWLGGNAPVIVVLSRPDDDLAWWFDVRAEFSDPRRRAERRVVINKHTQAFDKSAAPAIMQLGVPRNSDLFLPSPPKKEVLTTNLLPIEDWPQTVFVAPTTMGSYTECRERLKQERTSAPGWLLHDGVVVSFGDLTTSPLRTLCDGGAERHDTAEWADSNDEDRRRQFADLLRRTLIADHGRDLQWHQARHHAHFRPTRDLKPRVVGRGQGRRGRTVFSSHNSKADPERVSYYHHAALSPRFRRIGSRWYCQLGVDYCFTNDGVNEASFADGLLAGIKRFDRHPAVAGWTRMWERYLQPDLLTSGAFLVFGSLLTFEVDRGIDEAWWGPAPATNGSEDLDPKTDLDLDATLNDAGIDQQDLLSLLDEYPEPTESDDGKANASNHVNGRKASVGSRRARRGR